MIRIVTTALVAGAFGVIASAPTLAGDACAGQSWPNLSKACIEQRTKQLADTLKQKTKPASAQARAGAVKTTVR